MLRDQKNSKKQGDVGHGIAIGWFASNGYTVCIPLTDSQDYDLVVDNGNGLKKVQVKTTYYKSKYGVYQVNLKVCGGNKSSSTVKRFCQSFADYVFVVTEDGMKYLIPTSVIKAENALNLGHDKDKFLVG